MSSGPLGGTGQARTAHWSAVSLTIANTHEAKTHLSQLLERVAKGEEIIIAKAGKPVARLVGLSAGDRVRSGGRWRGLVHIAEDFDAPLPAEIDRGFRGPS